MIKTTEGWERSHKATREFGLLLCYKCSNRSKLTMRSGQVIHYHMTWQQLAWADVQSSPSLGLLWMFTEIVFSHRGS